MPPSYDNHGRGRDCPRTTIRWTKDEHRELAKRAKAAKLPIQEYVRRAVFPLVAT